MSTSNARSKSRAWLGACAVAAIAASSLGAAPGPSDGAAPDRAPSHVADRSGNGTGKGIGNYDIRLIGGDQRDQADSRQLRTTGKAVSRLSRDLGPGAAIAIDPLTGTPAQVSAPSTLTGSSGRTATEIALGYVRDHLAAFGLDRADLATLVKVRQDRDLHGITHVYWTQQIAGVPVFDNGLRVHVDGQGRLISIQGAPVAGLDRLARRAPSSRIDRDAAIRKAVADARLADPDLRPGAFAERVWFLAPDGLRPGWLTYTEPGTAAAYEHVIDAASGATLYRRSTIAFEGSGDAFVHENYPGATGQASGGRSHHVNLIKLGILLRRANFPKGKYATVWPDVNDDNKRQGGETTRLPESMSEARRMRLTPFKTAAGELACTRRYPCTWDPSEARSWRKNMAQDAIQGLYALSRYAKWLSRAPFGFDRASGNFTRKGHDPVDLNTLDGADIENGFPDGHHINNANFNTPPDGRRPRMQMYLNSSPYLAASSSQDFLTLGHEFTHGLSNRLVVNSNNRSTLRSYQGGGMGEGWSDFYAYDYLLTRGLVTNTDTPGELSLDLYLAKNRNVTRTEAIDCGIGELSPKCVQVETGDPGGYTYDDVGDGQLANRVHDVGEVWSQTLFDIREQLGHKVTMSIVTEGMRLSPNNPSMLDMRDAILAADQAIYRGTHHAALWTSFADRGFGFYAGSDGGSDPAPVASFSPPPPAGTRPGSISGTITDRNGDPLAGAVVRIPGHSQYADVTDDAGGYTIKNVPVGTWPKVIAAYAGHEPNSRAVTVTGGAVATFDASLRRDWASASGGASVASFTGSDYSPFCGPGAAIDLSPSFGWSSNTTRTGLPATSEADIHPKHIVLELPQSIAVTAFGVNPAATCDDDDSSSTKDFKIYVAKTAAGPWGAPVAKGTFTSADRGKLVEIPLATPVADVGAVKYVMVSPQVPDWTACPNYDGCTFMDTTEIAAYDN